MDFETTYAFGPLLPAGAGVDVREGRVVQLTQFCDLFTIMSQIGALPTAAPA